MRTERIFKLFGLIMIITMLVSACQPATTATVVSAEKKAAKMVIAGVVFQSDTFMQTVQAGIQAAGDKAGVEVLLGNTENKLEKEASMIDDYIARKVNAIVITPISKDGSLAAL